MKERPILFSGAMVRALLAGTKTQTRRVVKPQPTHFNPVGVPRRVIPTGGPSDVIRCPYGQPGDRLWVRESGAMHALLAPEDPLQPMLFRHDVPTTANLGDYWVQRTRAPGASYSTECTREQFLRHSGAKAVPSIHMPRWASRITLELTSVRVERLQDISEADAMAEGIVECPIPADDEGPRRIGYMVGPDDGKSGLAVTAVNAYRDLWESINGPDSWDANPWVWAIEFKRLP